jgi:hypothetical protein
MSAPVMQVMLEPFHAGEHHAAERFDSFAPCGAESGAGLSVRKMSLHWGGLERNTGFVWLSSQCNVLQIL